eukprot:6467184-Amphidinium_carterae.2
MLEVVTLDRGNLRLHGGGKPLCFCMLLYSALPVHGKSAAEETLTQHKTEAFEMFVNIQGTYPICRSLSFAGARFSAFWQSKYFFRIEVVRTWKKRKAEPGTAYVGDEKADLRRRLGAYFQRVRAQAKQGPRHKQSAPMLSNILMAKGLDRALKMGLNRGLQAYVCKGPTLLLPAGVTRTCLPVTDLHATYDAGGRARKSMLVQGTSIRMELPDRPFKSIHCLQDCGSVGFSAGLWMFTRGSVMGTFASDTYAHDAHNSVRAACVQTGVWGLLLEYTLVGNWTKGPFQSDAFYSNFQEAALDVVAVLESEAEEDSVLWSLFYEEISRALGIWDSSE